MKKISWFSKFLILSISSLILISGCSAIQWKGEGGYLKGEDTTRYIFYQKQKARETFSVCVESPPFSMQDIATEIKLDFPSLTVDQQSILLDLINSRNQSQYERSDLLRIVLYNLCQARANGFLDDEGYEQLLAGVILASDPNLSPEVPNYFLKLYSPTFFQ